MVDIFTVEAVRSLGILIHDDDKELYLVKLCNDKLAERIGITFLSCLTEEEMEIYDELYHAGKSKEASDYLIQFVDDPAQRMKDEIDIIFGELAENYQYINEVFPTKLKLDFWDE